MFGTTMQQQCRTPIIFQLQLSNEVNSPYRIVTMGNFNALGVEGGGGLTNKNHLKNRHTSFKEVQKHLLHLNDMLQPRFATKLTED